jgi:hypothetical protein
MTPANAFSAEFSLFAMTVPVVLIPFLATDVAILFTVSFAPSWMAFSTASSIPFVASLRAAASVLQRSDSFPPEKLDRDPGDLPSRTGILFLTDASGDTATHAILAWRLHTHHSHDERRVIE